MAKKRLPPYKGSGLKQSIQKKYSYPGYPGFQPSMPKLSTDDLYLEALSNLKKKAGVPPNAWELVIVSSVETNSVRFTVYYPEGYATVNYDKHALVKIPWDIFIPSLWKQFHDYFYKEGVEEMPVHLFDEVDVLDKIKAVGL